MIKIVVKKLNIRRETICKHGMLFELKSEVLNESTIAAIEEGRRIMSDPAILKYSDMDSLKVALEVQ